MRISGTSLISFEGRRWEAMKGFNFFFFMMVSGTAKSTKNVKWWCSGTDFFGNLWKWYAPERKFRAENGGLSRGPICLYMIVPPPSWGGGGAHDTAKRCDANRFAAGIWAACTCFLRPLYLKILDPSLLLCLYAVHLVVYAMQSKHGQFFSSRCARRDAQANIESCTVLQLPCLSAE